MGAGGRLTMSDVASPPRSAHLPAPGACNGACRPQCATPAGAGRRVGVMGRWPCRNCPAAEPAPAACGCTAGRQIAQCNCSQPARAPAAPPRPPACHRGNSRWRRGADALRGAAACSAATFRSSQPVQWRGGQLALVRASCAQATGTTPRRTLHCDPALQPRSSLPTHSSSACRRALLHSTRCSSPALAAGPGVVRCAYHSSVCGSGRGGAVAPVGVRGHGNAQPDASSTHNEPSPLAALWPEPCWGSRLSTCESKSARAVPPAARRRWCIPLAAALFAAFVCGIYFITPRRVLQARLARTRAGRRHLSPFAHLLKPALSPHFTPRRD